MPRLRYCLLALWLCASVSSAVQQPADGAVGPPVGELIERVECGADDRFSYALFLPSGYTPEQPWPLILAFDPVGIGRRPVERYRDAAERFGYIVAGSNDSRNYTSWEAQLGAAQAMWRDVAGRFNLDGRRVYTTGFSGGARVAGEVALLTGAVAGVMAHGASFRDREAVKEDLPFVFAGAVGGWDMNYQEMRQVHGRMEELGLVHRAFVFDGPHQWAPPEVCTRMVEWLELRAAQSGRSQLDDATLDTMIAREVAAASELEEQGRPAEAQRAWSCIARDFAGLADVEQATTAAARLAGAAETRRALRRQDKLAQDEHTEQKRLVTKVKSMMAQRNDPTERAAELQWWRREADRLRARIDSPVDVEDERLARRLQGFVSALCYEKGVVTFQDGDHGQALIYSQIGTILHPDSHYFHYQLARCYAATGMSRRALETLGQAIDLGFADAAALRAEPAFEGLRQRPEFTNLLSRLD